MSSSLTTIDSSDDLDEVYKTISELSTFHQSRPLMKQNTSKTKKTRLRKQLTEPDVGQRTNIKRNESVRQSAVAKTTKNTAKSTDDKDNGFVHQSLGVNTDETAENKSGRSIKISSGKNKLKSDEKSDFRRKGSLKEFFGIKAKRETGRSIRGKSDSSAAGKSAGSIERKLDTKADGKSSSSTDYNTVSNAESKLGEGAGSRLSGKSNAKSDNSADSRSGNSINDNSAKLSGYSDSRSSGSADNRSSNGADSNRGISAEGGTSSSADSKTKSSFKQTSKVKSEQRKEYTLDSHQSVKRSSSSSSEPGSYSEKQGTKRRLRRINTEVCKL